MSFKLTALSAQRRLDPVVAETDVLVVGSGPAGLECARALGQRGYRVAVAERDRTLGGRVTKESALPGLRSARGFPWFHIKRLTRKTGMSTIYLIRQLTS